MNSKRNVAAISGLVRKMVLHGTLDSEEASAITSAFKEVAHCHAVKDRKGLEKAMNVFCKLLMDAGDNQ